MEVRKKLLAILEDDSNQTINKFVTSVQRLIYLEWDIVLVEESKQCPLMPLVKNLIFKNQNKMITKRFQKPYVGIMAQWITQDFVLSLTTNVANARKCKKINSSQNSFTYKKKSQEI